MGLVGIPLARDSRKHEQEWVLQKSLDFTAVPMSGAGGLDDLREPGPTAAGAQVLTPSLQTGGCEGRAVSKQVPPVPGTWRT